MSNQISKKVEHIYDLTPLQKGMLYHNMLDSDSKAYVLQDILKIYGEFNDQYMKGSLDLLAEKYDVLRTLIMFRNVEVPKQIVLKERSIEYSVDKIAVSHMQDIEHEVNKIAEGDIERGFNLDKDTLIRVKCIHTSDNSTYIIITAHHICVDGWCMSLLLHDIAYFYQALSEKKSIESLKQEISVGRAETAPYRDYVKWIAEQDEEEGMRYWEKLLADYDEPAAAPLADTNALHNTGAGIEEIVLKQLLSEQIRNFSKQRGITLSLLFEAAWAVLLMKHSRTTDIVFGKVVSGRQKDLRGIEKAVGLYINTIPVRFCTKPEDKIIEVLQQALEQELDSFPYDYCSLSDIQQQSGIHGELINSVFVFENYYVQYNEETNFAGMPYEITGSREQTNYPISVGAFDTEEGLKFGMIYDKGIYCESDIRRMCSQMKMILEYMINNPEESIGSIEIVTDHEKKQILHEFNQPPVWPADNKTIVDLFEDKVKQYGNEVALKDSNTELSYQELNTRANQLAHKLRQIGIEPDDFVVIAGRRSIDIVCGIWGVIKAGGCYVPIDLDEAPERLRYKIQDCNPKAVITEDSSVQIEVDVPVIALDCFEFGAYSAENPSKTVRPENLIYTIYTSGTTGKPKGVLIEHRNAVNFCEIIPEDYQVKERTRMMLFASITFDASVGQILIAFMQGGMLYIPDSELSSDPKYIQEVIEKERLTFLSFPPQFAGQLQATNCELVLTAGSEAGRELVKNTISYADYINAYGPTEASICATYWACEKGGVVPEKTPIGKPHKNYLVYILNQGKLCGIGCPGELAIGGAGLARGYLNQKELTQEKFIPNPYGEGKLYLTGDLARWMPDGNIEYLGRIDEQVKVRGYRVELSEVEGALSKVAGIRDCVVITVKNCFDDMCLAAYAVSDQKICIENVRKGLSRYLPPYMIPDYVIQVEKIPVTINGKINKKELEQVIIASDAPYDEPESKLEKLVSGVFGQILGVEKIGANDRFVDHGGNSINAMRLVALLQKENIVISMADAVALQTPRKIAGHIEESQTSEEIKRINEIDSKIELTSWQCRNRILGNVFDTVAIKSEERFDNHVLDRVLQEIIAEQPILGYQLTEDEKFMIKSEERISSHYTKWKNEINKKEVKSCIEQRLWHERKRSISVTNLHSESANYLLISFNSIFIDEHIKLILVDDFMTKYKECQTYSAQNREDNWSSSAERMISLPQMENFNKDKPEHYYKLTYQVTEMLPASHATRISSRGSLKCDMEVVITDALKALGMRVSEVTISIADKEDYISCIAEAGMEYFEFGKGELVSNTKNHIAVIVEDGQIRMDYYRDTSLDSVDWQLIHTGILDATAKFANANIPDTEQFKWDMMEKKLVKDCLMESYCVEKEYPVLTRQSIFLKSNFATICIGKAIILGAFDEEQLVRAANKVIKGQSAFRSILSEQEDMVKELQYTDNYKIPYFDLSTQKRTQKNRLLSEIEVAGCSVERFIPDHLLAHHCIVKVSANVHLIYLFAHHILCDMISIHLWNREIRKHVFHNDAASSESRYSDFVELNQVDEDVPIGHREKAFLQEFGEIKNEEELCVICRDREVRGQLEVNPSQFAVKLLKKIAAIYNKEFDGDIPFLFVHHGRNQENSSVMGLFINVFKLICKKDNDGAVVTDFQKVIDGNVSKDSENIMNYGRVDLNAIAAYPLINIVIAQMDYVPEIINRLYAKEEKIFTDTSFTGISIEIQFFNDAVRLMLKCNTNIKEGVGALCIKEMGGQAYVEQMPKYKRMVE